LCVILTRSSFESILKLFRLISKSKIRHCGILVEFMHALIFLVNCNCRSIIVSLKLSVNRSDVQFV